MAYKLFFLLLLLLLLLLLFIFHASTKETAYNKVFSFIDPCIKFPYPGHRLVRYPKSLSCV